MLYIEKAETTPDKNSGTRIKPLPLANGHGRYITVALELEQKLVSVGEWSLHKTVIFLTASLLPVKRLRNGRFDSETAVRPFQF